MKQQRFLTVSAIAAVALTALTGCAGGDSGSASALEDGELVHVTYGSFPTNPVASIQYAIDAGVFEEQGIDLEVVVGAGSSAAQLPALASGELDFMLASPVTALTAQAQGLDIKIVSGVIENDPDVVEDAAAVVVGPGSDIASAKDLSGRTVAVNALGSIGEIAIREAVELDGGDGSSVKFVQLSFPEVSAQLASGQIDAGMSVSPFMDAEIEGGGAMFTDFITETGLGDNELVTITSGKFAAENPDIIERWRVAWAEAAEFINENNDGVRELIPEVLGTPEDVAANVKLARHGSEIRPATIQRFADLLVKYEITDKEPDVDAVILP